MSDMTREGRRLAQARAALRDATEKAKAAAVRDVANGATEAETARRYGVTRMTIRAWLGKTTKERA